MKVVLGGPLRLMIEVPTCFSTAVFIYLFASLFLAVLLRAGFL